MQEMILSIESSCDDSSIALTEIKTKKLIFHKKISQELEHSKFGGVVPELAARMHAEALPKILEECKPYFKNLKAVALTTEPGLSVSLMEGLALAKGLGLGLNIPLISSNHLKGHIYSLFIEKEASLPCLILLVSGGHTELIEANSLNNMSVLASTLDDSFGESFDKLAKMLNLSYPGGPVIEKLAINADENAFSFPVPLKNSPKFAFSYSGLKNALRLKIEELKAKDELNDKNIKNLCASFQKVAVEHLLQKTKKYFRLNPPKNFALVGGASANLYLRAKVQKLCDEFGTKLLLAKLEYCSDNAVMIGRLALEQYKIKDFTPLHELDISSKSRVF